jgi:transposase-like protein
MLSEQRDKTAVRTFLRRLLAMTPQKPLRVTTDKHPAYGKPFAGSWDETCSIGRAGI